MNLTNEEIQKLESCTSEDQWNDTCDAIKKARGGQYPPDWFPIMLATGKMNRIALRWQ